MKVSAYCAPQLSLIHIFSLGTNGLMHDETTTNGWYIGSDPAGTGCNGANNALFENFEHAITIAHCGAQYALTFINASGGVINNQATVPYTTSSLDHYFDSGPPQTYGWPGISYPAFSESTLTYSDPGAINFVGHNGISLYATTPHAGLNEQFLLDTGSIYMRASLCSDGWWNTSTQLWNVGSNGAGDVSCWVAGNGWNGLVAYPGTVNTTISQTTLNNNVAMATNTSGHTVVGKGIIDNGSGALLDDGNTCLLYTSVAPLGPVVDVTVKVALSTKMVGLAESTALIIVEPAFNGVQTAEPSVLSTTKLAMVASAMV